MHDDERAHYFSRYIGRVHRTTRDMIGVADDAREVAMPEGSLVRVVDGFYATDERPVVPWDGDDNFRFCVVLLTATGADDRRGISYDGASHHDLEFEPGIIDWAGEDAAPQGWEIFYRDSPNDDGEIWELQAVTEEDRFTDDAEAHLYVWKRATLDFDPLARRALAFLFHRAPAEYARVRKAGALSTEA
jgi:hypothetical protein